jgi:hypothetical protein
MKKNAEITFKDVILKHTGGQYGELTDLTHDVTDAISNDFELDKDQATKLFDSAYQECGEFGYGAIIEQAYQLGQLFASVMGKDIELVSFAELSDKVFCDQLFPMVRMAISFVRNIDTVVAPYGEKGQQRLAAIGWDTELRDFLLQVLKMHSKYTQEQFWH